MCEDHAYVPTDGAPAILLPRLQSRTPTYFEVISRLLTGPEKTSVPPEMATPQIEQALKNTPVAVSDAAKSAILALIESANREAERLKGGIKKAERQELRASKLEELRQLVGAEAAVSGDPRAVAQSVRKLALAAMVERDGIDTATAGALMDQFLTRPATSPMVRSR